MNHPITHKVFLSLEQPEQILTTLLTAFKEIQADNAANTALITPLHAHTILLIDEDTQRAHYVARLLSSAGYKPFIASSALEAFTLFLHGTFVPFVILLSQEDTNDRFFLSRLLQQVTQKYHWDTPLLSLCIQPHLLHTDDFAPVSGPLAEFSPILREMSPHISTQSTAPLPKLPDTPSVLDVEEDEQKPFPPSSMALAPLISQRSERVVDKPLEKYQEKLAQKISLEGVSIGRYQMKTSLGSGPLGQVYLTYDRLRERDIALKVIQMNTLPPDIGTHMEEETNFFQQEIDLLSILSHPNILSPLNCGKSYVSGSPFVYKTMPYFSEGSLAALRYQLGVTRLLSPQEVIPLVVQIADALQHAHTHNVTYQNFKFSNLLIRSKEQDIRRIHILLTDFAVAQNGSFLVKTPELFPYMAPERWNGQSLPASDQYGLAALTYELLTGRALFIGQSEWIMRQLHLNMQPQPLTMFSPMIPSTLSAVILRALSKRVDDRFPSVMAFAQAMQYTCS